MSTRNSQTQPLPGGLYIVATPIGNLADMTHRAVLVLGGVDIIACEDTRTSATLLNHYGIRGQLIAYHDHNGEKVRPKLLTALAEGKKIALISDAGTPLISDPGYKLVKDVREAGFKVWPIPGASSITAALSAAGLPTDQFHFAGFLPPKSAACARVLKELAALPATLVFLEAPGRLVDSLHTIAETLGERQVAIARELTKKFEEIRSGDATSLAAHYEKNPPKGEIVLLVAPPATVAPRSEYATEEVLVLALEYMSVKDAAAFTSKLTGEKKTELYKRAVELTSRG